MRTTTSCCMAAVAGLFAYGAAACENPSLVANMPDGATATEQQMIAAQTEVKAYVAAMETYIACVDNELEAKGDDAPAEYKSLMIMRHNAAITEMESLVAAFNEQLKAYRTAKQSAAAPPAAN